MDWLPQWARPAAWIAVALLVAAVAIMGVIYVLAATLPNGGSQDNDILTILFGCFGALIVIVFLIAAGIYVVGVRRGEWK